MKKILVIPILLLFAFGQLGYYFVFQYQQKIARREAKKMLYVNIPESSLYSIELADAEKNITWTEKGKEFYFKGEMFDVVKIKKRDGKFVIYCISDRKEKDILSGLANLAGAQSDKNNKTGKITIKYQLPDFIIRPLMKLSVINTCRSPLHFSFDTPLLSVVSTIQAPPPRQFSA